MAAADAPKASYTVEQRGTKHTTDYRLYFKDAEGNYVSPWHDIPAYTNPEKTIVNMVCEIPRWSNAKMEVTKELPLNPIAQDTKKGEVRFVHNVFPHKGYIFNYGAIPQTWENPDKTDKHTSAKGDDDPIDIVEIGESVCTAGQVKQVKVLGVMAMIDEGETDWKIIGIDVNDPAAALMNDIDDVDKVMPGMLAATNEWFRIYKMPAGKPENTFAFNGEAKNKEFALGIIAETHEFWKEMVSADDGPSKLERACTTRCGDSGCKTKMSQEDAKAVVEKNPAAAAADKDIPATVQKWHYVNL